MWAQHTVLESFAAVEEKNSIFEIASDSEPLTDDDAQELEQYMQTQLKRHKTRQGYNTLTVKKLTDGKWVARRATWIQSWSSPKKSLEEVFAKI